MHYTPPEFKGNPQWVPIVVKNKDFLVGYISGLNLIQDLMLDALENSDIDVDLRGISLCLDSSRFNDVLENGKRESECSDEEIQKYYKDMVEEKINMVEEKHPDNTGFENCFLEVECPCGLGIYMFKTPDEVPEIPFKCQVCGRTVIDYTGYPDSSFKYDGKLKERKDYIMDNLIEKWENEHKRNNDDESQF